MDPQTDTQIDTQIHTFCYNIYIQEVAKGQLISEANSRTMGHRTGQTLRSKAESWPWHIDRNTESKFGQKGNSLKLQHHELSYQKKLMCQLFTCNNASSETWCHLLSNIVNSVFQREPKVFPIYYFLNIFLGWKKIVITEI